MKSHISVFIALCACVVLVHSQDQVTVGKIGSKTFTLLEGSKSVDWDTAETLCKGKGLVLAALENSKENDLVSEFVVKRAPLRDLNDSVHVCIGGSDKKSEGKWYWVGSNKPISYSNWSANEPQESNHYNCMMMRPVGDNKKAQWMSHYCDAANCRPLCQSV